MVALLAMPFFVSTATNNNSLVSVSGIARRAGAVYKARTESGSAISQTSSPIATS
jgi:hypothetical protein